ncbi:DUF2851 family protein [Fluviicola taffensis]|uniref:DUF2851 family protein n=1 Tax=Fluviicola taffensis TaxID=191579 RepID=UPI00313844E3
MNEKYLHFIWKSKRLLSAELTTTTGESVRIKNFGDYNFDSGPDFFNGSILLGGLLLYGNIEMHVNSSDWMKHGHQFDLAYSNVILHVVYNHDMEIVVNGSVLPTLELKYLIDWKHFNESKQKLEFQSRIPCDQQLKDVPTKIVSDQLKRNTHDRLQRKANEIEHLSENLRWSIHELLFRFLLKTFGGKLNGLPFLELANQIPVYRFLRSSMQVREAILLGLAGFLDHDFDHQYEKELKSNWTFQKHRLQLSNVDSSSFKFKGARPASFPALRLVQFAAFSNHFDWSCDFWSLEPTEIVKIFMDALTKEPTSYWENHYHLGRPKQKPSSGKLAKEASLTIVINAVAPFLFWYGQKQGNIVLLNKAIELLELLPQEKNKVLERWKSLVSYPSNARFGQAVLELNNQWCAPKKCLKCLIGKELLNLSQS